MRRRRLCQTGSSPTTSLAGCTTLSRAGRFGHLVGKVCRRQGRRRGAVGLALRRQHEDLRGPHACGQVPPARPLPRRHRRVLLAAHASRAPRGSPGVRRRVVLQGGSAPGEDFRTAVSLGFILPHGGHHVRWPDTPGVIPLPPHGLIGRRNRRARHERSGGGRLSRRMALAANGPSGSEGAIRAVRLCGLDLAGGMLTLDCEPCGRHGRYRLKTLVEVYGPRAGLPDIRRVLVSKGECHGSSSPPRPCHVRFKGLHDARRPDPSC